MKQKKAKTFCFFNKAIWLQAFETRKSQRPWFYWLNLVVTETFKVVIECSIRTMAP